MISVEDIEAANVLDGTIIGRNMQPHCHQEFIRFLNASMRRSWSAGWSTPSSTITRPHKHRKVQAWFGRHPRWALDFTPTSACWLNAVETFFSAFTRRRLKRGAFCSITDL